MNRCPKIFISEIHNDTSIGDYQLMSKCQKLINVWNVLHKHLQHKLVLDGFTDKNPKD